MTRRALISAALAAAALLSGLPARADDKPKTTSAAAAAPALSPAHQAKLNRLKALPQAEAKLALAVGVGRVPLKPMAVKKEVSCGIYVYPPNPNPMAVSPRLFFVNTTGQPIPVGAKVDWEVEGYPSTCCKGTGHTTAYWQPNPPSALFLQSDNIVYPPQPWTRECKAWVTLP